MSMRPLNPSKYSLGDQVYEELRRGIVSQELKPGELYSVAALAERLGVSRTPVREALLQFAANGVVRFERNRGVRILEVSIKDIEEIYAIRLLLEPPSAFMAAVNASDEQKQELQEIFEVLRTAAKADDEATFQEHDIRFHSMILEISGNERVIEAVNVARSQMHALGLSTTASRKLLDVLDAHEPILDAILAGDAEAAATAVHTHLTGTLTLLVHQSLTDAEEIANYRLPFADWIEHIKPD